MGKVLHELDLWMDDFTIKKKFYIFYVVCVLIPLIVTDSVVFLPGIGATRRKALMKYFDSIEEVRNASEETLAGIDSMDARSARSVYEFFHKEDQEEDLQNSSSKEAPDC